MIYQLAAKGTPIQILTPYASAWYILSLILWRLCISKLAKIRGIMPFSIAVALLIGFWSEVSNALSLCRTVAMFPFFLMGYKLQESKLQDFLNRRTVPKTIAGILFTAASTLILYRIIQSSSITPRMLMMQPYSSGRELLLRGFILIAAGVVILAMLFTVPNHRVPILTKAGKNSLLLYLSHRIFALIFGDFFPNTHYSKIYLIYAGLATAAVVLIFGSDWLNKRFNQVLNWLASELVTDSSKYGRRIIAGLMAVILLVTSVPLFSKLENRIRNHRISQTAVSDIISDTIVLSFVGDLILLKDQVESAYDAETGEYRFEPMFEHVKEYFAHSDLTIGVFEGPMAGAEKGYSTSNFYDRANFSLNFPDSFAQAIKDSGIDLVSTANNHLLDKGTEGAVRTLDILDQVGLMHTGSYRNVEEKNEPFLIDVQGIRLAILSYTWHVNDHTLQQVLSDYPYITSVLPDKRDSFFQQVMADIRQDFQQAKQANADLIIVIPHMGTQFSHETDEFQDFWNQTFSDLGADIILGDHAHAVQPLEQIGDTLIVNCPGNFANSYIQYNGDAASIVEIYIDKQDKIPVASAVVPLYVQEMKSGFFRAIPIFEIMTKNALYAEMTHLEWDRIRQAHELITSVMIGEKISTENIQPRYFFIDGIYRKSQDSLLKNMAPYRDSELYRLMEPSSSIVFIGDSITYGSHNSSHPWYEPIMAHFPNTEVVNISKPSVTLRNAVHEFGDAILNSKGDLYVIALGTNDVRYRDGQNCALTPEAYIEDMERLISLVRSANPSASIALVAPWVTLDNDRNSRLDQDEKLEMVCAYSDALQEYALENGFCFLDANPLLLSFFEEHQRFQYTNDGVHPNETKGIDLYAWAVMESSR